MGIDCKVSTGEIEALGTVTLETLRETFPGLAWQLRPHRGPGRWVLQQGILRDGSETWQDIFIGTPHELRTFALGIVWGVAIERGKIGR